MMTLGQHRALGKDVERYSVLRHVPTTMTQGIGYHISERAISWTCTLSTSTGHDRGRKSSFRRCKHV